MTSLPEIIRSAHSTLNSLVEHLDVLEEIEGKRKSAETQLKATSQELSMASKRLEQVKFELKKAEDALTGKRHIINDEAARALQDVNRQIAAQQDEARKLDKEIAEKRGELQNTIEGMKALQQRLRV